MSFIKRIKFFYLLLFIFLLLPLEGLYSLRASWINNGNNYFDGHFPGLLGLNLLPDISIFHLFIIEGLSAISEVLMVMVLLIIGYTIYKARKKSTFLITVISVLLFCSIFRVFSSIEWIFSGNISVYTAPQLLAGIFWTCFFTLMLHKLEDEEKNEDISNYKVANKFHRLVNFFIDGSLIFMFVVLSSKYEMTNSSLVIPRVSSIVSSIALVLIFIIYYTFFEYKFGYTIGKLISGTRVVQEDGTPLTGKQSIMRTLIRYIPVEPFTYLMKSNGWHDAWVKTKVIKVEKTLNRWYYYVIPIPAILVLLISFSRLDTNLDEPYFDKLSKISQSKSIELQLGNLVSHFEQLDTNKVITFDFTVPSSFFSIPCRVINSSSDSLSLSSTRIVVSSCSQEFTSLPAAIYAEKANLEEEDIQSSIVNFQLSRDNFQNKDILSDKILQALHLNEQSSQEIRLANVSVDFYDFPGMNNFDSFNFQDLDSLSGNHLEMYYEITQIKATQEDVIIKNIYPIIPHEYNPPFESRELRFAIGLNDGSVPEQIAVQLRNRAGQVKILVYNKGEYSDANTLWYTKQIWK